MDNIILEMIKKYDVSFKNMEKIIHYVICDYDMEIQHHADTVYTHPNIAKLLCKTIIDDYRRYVFFDYDEPRYIIREKTCKTIYIDTDNEEEYIQAFKDIIEEATQDFLFERLMQHIYQKHRDIFDIFNTTYKSARNNLEDKYVMITNIKKIIDQDEENTKGE